MGEKELSQMQCVSGEAGEKDSPERGNHANTDTESAHSIVGGGKSQHLSEGRERERRPGK